MRTALLQYHALEIEVLAGCEQLVKVGGGERRKDAEVLFAAVVQSLEEPAPVGVRIVDEPAAVSESRSKARKFSWVLITASWKTRSR